MSASNPDSDTRVGWKQVFLFPGEPLVKSRVAAQSALRDGQGEQGSERPGPFAAPPRRGRGGGRLLPQMAGFASNVSQPHSNAADRPQNPCTCGLRPDRALCVVLLGIVVPAAAPTRRGVALWCGRGCQAAAPAIGCCAVTCRSRTFVARLAIIAIWSATRLMEDLIRGFLETYLMTSGFAS